jgi:hypothetical protein
MVKLKLAENQAATTSQQTGETAPLPAAEGATTSRATSRAIADIEVQREKELKHITPALEGRRGFLNINIAGKEVSANIGEGWTNIQDDIPLTPKEKKEVLQQFRLKDDGDLTGKEFSDWQRDFSKRVLQRISDEIHAKYNAQLAAIQSNATPAAAAPTTLDTKNIEVNGITLGNERIFGEDGVGDVRDKLPYGENNGTLVLTGKDGNKYVVAFSRVGGDGSNIFEKVGKETGRPGQINVAVRISDNATEQEIAAATAQAEGGLQVILPTIKNNFIDPRAIRDVLSNENIPLSPAATSQQINEAPAAAAPVTEATTETGGTTTDAGTQPVADESGRPVVEGENVPAAPAVTLTEGKAPVIAEMAREFLNIDRLVAKGFVNYVDSKTGKPCAKFGMRDNAFSRGGKWEIVKDLKGYATHEKGGVDLTIDGKGVRIGGPDSKLYAADGLLMPGDGEPITPERKKQLAEEQRAKFGDYIKHPSYINRLQNEIFGDDYKATPEQNDVLNKEYQRRLKNNNEIAINTADIGDNYGLYTQKNVGILKSKEGKRDRIDITNVEKDSPDHPSMNENTYRQVVDHELGHASHLGAVTGLNLKGKETPGKFEELVEKYNDKGLEAFHNMFNPNLDTWPKKLREETIKAAEEKMGPDKVREVLQRKKQFYEEMDKKMDEYGDAYNYELHGPVYPKELNEIMDVGRYRHLLANDTEIATRMIGIRRLAADKFGYDFNTPFDIKKYKDQIRQYFKENKMIDEMSDLDGVLKLSDDQINEMMKYIAKNNSSNGEVYG